MGQITAIEIEYLKDHPADITPAALPMIKKVLNIQSTSKAIDTIILEGFQAHKSAPSDANGYTITLTPKIGYKINGKKDAFVSSEFTVTKFLDVVTIHPKPISEIEINKIGNKPAAMNAEQLLIAQKVFRFNFNIIESDPLKAFKLHKTGGIETNNVYTLVLTANDGFEIGFPKAKFIESQSFTVNTNILVEKIEGILDISAANISVFEKTPTQVQQNQLAIIKKAFKITGSSADIMNALNVHIQAVPNATNKYKLVLTAKLGFIINTNFNSLESAEFEVDFNFDIKPKLANLIKLTQAQIDSIPLVKQNITPDMLEVIKLVFDMPNGLDAEIISGLQINKEVISDTSFKLHLTVKSGFIIDFDKETLPSNEFIVDTILTISSKPAAEIKITEEEIKEFLTTKSITEKGLETLKKAFNITGIHNAAQANM
jgi:hypothetical protein